MGLLKDEKKKGIRIGSGKKDYRGRKPNQVKIGRFVEQEKKERGFPKRRRIKRNFYQVWGRARRGGALNPWDPRSPQDGVCQGRGTGTHRERSEKRHCLKRQAIRAPKKKGKDQDKDIYLKFVFIRLAF